MKFGGPGTAEKSQKLPPAFRERWPSSHGLTIGAVNHLDAYHKPLHLGGQSGPDSTPEAHRVWSILAIARTKGAMKKTTERKHSLLLQARSLPTLRHLAQLEESHLQT